MASDSTSTSPTRVRCVSILLDKNRRYIGKSQSKRPPKRTQRTPHLRPGPCARRAAARCCAHGAPGACRHRAELRCAAAPRRRRPSPRRLPPRHRAAPPRPSPRAGTRAAGRRAWSGRRPRRGPPCTCPKRLVIEARWGSKPLAFAGKLQPRRLIRSPFWTHASRARPSRREAEGGSRLSEGSTVESLRQRHDSGGGHGQGSASVFVSWAGASQLGAPMATSPLPM
jgi:hypothetical protein